MRETRSGRIIRKKKEKSIIMSNTLQMALQKAMLEDVMTGKRAHGVVEEASREEQGR